MIPPTDRPGWVGELGWLDLSSEQIHVYGGGIGLDRSGVEREGCLCLFFRSYILSVYNRYGLFIRDKRGEEGMADTMLSLACWAGGGGGGWKDTDLALRRFADGEGRQRVGRFGGGGESATPNDDSLPLVEPEPVYP